MTILPSAGLRARVALDKHGFRTTHSLGQNFLLDDRFLSGLLDEIDVRPEDRVLEIGPGAGVMTALLAERAEKVLAVELDERLAPVLSDVLAPHENAKVEYCDFLRCDVDALTARTLGEQYRVVANLPYYITADILTKLVGAKNPPASIAIMVQKEAAQRLMSEPGSKQWCALAATVRAYGRAEVVEEVPPERFDPAPHVVSCFLKIDAWDALIVTPKDEALYRRVVQAAFAMRRKTLANNLKTSFGVSQEQTQAVLSAAGLSDKVRGEALTLAQLSDVSDALGEILG